ncbi:hypothetical protein VTO42DRAFT_4259 [Malbranchea cinnamomea]
MVGWERLSPDETVVSSDRQSWPPSALSTSSVVFASCQHIGISPHWTLVLESTSFPGASLAVGIKTLVSDLTARERSMSSDCTCMRAGTCPACRFHHIVVSGRTDRPSGHVRRLDVAPDVAIALVRCDHPRNDIQAAFLVSGGFSSHGLPGFSGAHDSVDSKDWKEMFLATGRTNAPPSRCCG